MSSRKEEERNEKIIRGLMKLPPNRRCINCNNLGPQYVCTNFWTFVCISCSGIHREFTHRVKSVSMSKFTTQEVEALQNGGNQRARDFFLRGWDMQNQRLPYSSNPDKVREFIKMVYVEKKYAKGMSSEKPPRDMQNDRNFAEENRKASSYHSYSQSPPYEHQYEERRYGKQSSLRTRRTGSDRIDYDGKFPGIISSPNHAVQEDRFANESSSSRFSVSSAGEMFRYETQSPISQKNAGYTSPPLQPLEDMLNEEANAKREVSAIPRSRRTASTGSYGLSNSTVPRSVYSTSLIDFVPQGKPLARTQVVETSKPSSADQPCHSNAANQDLFDLPSVHSAAKSSPQFEDLFAEINQPLSSASSDNNHVQATFPVNEGWATFDIPQYASSSTESKNTSHVMPPKDEKPVQNFIGFPYATNSSQSQLQRQSQPQNALAHNHVSWMNDQWSSPLENTSTSVPANTQIWDAFGDLSQNPSKPSMGSLPLKTTSQSSGDVRPAPTDIGDSYKIWTTEDCSAYSFQRTLDRNPLESVSYSGGVPAAPNTSSVIPMMGGNALEKKSSNPFDLPYGRDFEPGNAFLDMNTLQAALPNPSFPDPYIDNKCQPLYHQNAISQFVSPVPSGGSTYLGEYLPNPQLPNLSSQGNAASVGGNPFA